MRIGSTEFNHLLLERKINYFLFTSRKVKRTLRGQVREFDDIFFYLDGHIQLVYKSCLRNQRARELAKVAHDSRGQQLGCNYITTKSMSKVFISYEPYMIPIKTALFPKTQIKGKKTKLQYAKAVYTGILQELKKRNSLE